MTSNRTSNQQNRLSKSTDLTKTGRILLEAAVGLILLGSLGAVLIFAAVQPIFIGLVLLAAGALFLALCVKINRDYTHLAEVKNRLKKDSIDRDYIDSILNSMGDMLIVVDRQLKIKTVNQKACEMLGATAAELVGGKIQDFVSPNTRPRWMRDNDVQTAIFNLRHTECQMFAKDGSKLDILLSSSIMETAAHGYAVVCIGHDIRRQKEAEAAIIQAKIAAEAMADARTNFLANMSHEIRTPLNGVIGMSTLLMDTDLTEQQREYATIVQSGSEGLLDIVDDVLDFSKIDSSMLHLERSEFSPVEIGEQALDTVIGQAQMKGVDLSIYIGPAVPSLIMGDPNRLRQVLVNLLGNAIKFTPQNGFVSLEILLKQRLEFLVADSGIGIPLDRLDEIFEPFRQGDSSVTRIFGGTGLGLAITRKLIEMMGGKIRVESEVNNGSIFSFNIDTVFVDQQPVFGTLPWRKNIAGKQILIVSQGGKADENLQRQIEGWGGRVTILPSVADVEPVSELVSAFDLILADSTERKSGRAELNAATILMVEMGDSAESGLSSGYRAIIRRPLRPTHLGELLGRLLSGNGAETVVQRRSPSRQKPTGGEGIAPNHSLSILLVDDDVVNQTVGQKLLARLGYAADIAASGAEAVAASDQKSYDLILMDVKMTGMSGVEAATLIREIYEGEPQPKIIALTGMQSDDIVDEMAVLDGHLIKPLRIEPLGDLLARCRPLADVNVEPAADR